ncbi:MAG: hypothetical protein ACYC1U_09890 [Candidatus Aquicultorales bacterium]
MNDDNKPTEAPEATSQIAVETDPSAANGTTATGTAAPTVNVPTVSVNVGGEPKPAPRVYAPRNKRVAFQVLDFVFWIGSALVLLRFALKLAAANPLNGFVKFIYSMTDRAVGVFADVLGGGTLINLTPDSTPPNVIELSTLLAWLVFWILYMVAKKILTIATTPK